MSQERERWKCIHIRTYEDEPIFSSYCGINKPRCNPEYCADYETEAGTDYDEAHPGDKQE